jgi:hypothetical protein
VESRPATKEERAQWQIPDTDYFFRSDVHVKEAAFPFVGWGRVFAAETINGKGFKPVEKNPQRMAEKRAEAQALRKAFHIDLPSFEDIGSPVDDPNVVESTARVVEEVPVAGPPPVGKDYKRNPEFVRTFNEFSAACLQDFPDVIKTSQDAVIYAGYKSRMEIINYPEAYRKVAGLYAKEKEVEKL